LSAAADAAACAAPASVVVVAPACVPPPAAAMPPAPSRWAEGSAREDLDLDDDDDGSLSGGGRPAGGSWEAAAPSGGPRGRDFAALSPPDAAATQRYPFCVVWTALPGLTALLPVIGHMGVTDSRGVIYDFAGPYHVNVDAGRRGLAFGRVLRYLPLSPAGVTLRPPGATPAQAWDAAVDAANDVYCGRMHNIVCDNCHSHAALALERAGYAGRSKWPMVVVWAYFTFHPATRWASTAAAVATYAPLALIVVVVAAVRGGLV